MSFSSCSLFSTNYEYARFTESSVEYTLEFETKNYIDEGGYYCLNAQDSINTLQIVIIIPSDEYLSTIYIPYDNYSEIRIYRKSEGKIYSASSVTGFAQINIEEHPDSTFNQLSGTFSGELVNIDDESDTLKINSGYFLYMF